MTTVLVVDDEPIVREVVVSYFQLLIVKGALSPLRSGRCLGSRTTASAGWWWTAARRRAT
jgi:hypothetical protein